MEPTFRWSELKGRVQRSVVGMVVLVLALVLGAAVVWRSGLAGPALDDLLARARLEAVVVAWGVMLCGMLAAAARWRALMPSRGHIPLLPLSAMFSAGLLVNYAVPGPSGEAVSSWFVSKRFGVPVEDGFTSAVAARVVGLLGAALVAAGVWLVADLPVPDEIRGGIAGAAGLAGIGGLVLATLAAKPLWWKRLALAILGRFEGDEGLGKWIRKARAGFDRLADALAAVVALGPWAWAQAFGWNLVSQLAIASGCAIVAGWGLGSNYSFAGILFAYCLTTAGALIVLVLPGAQLMWDAMFATMLVASAGLRPADALVVAVVLRIEQMLMMLAGVPSLAWAAASAGVEEKGLE